MHARRGKYTLHTKSTAHDETNQRSYTHTAFGKARALGGHGSTKPSDYDMSKYLEERTRFGRLLVVHALLVDAENAFLPCAALVGLDNRVLGVLEVVCLERESFRKAASRDSDVRRARAARVCKT